MLQFFLKIRCTHRPICGPGGWRSDTAGNAIAGLPGHVLQLLSPGAQVVRVGCTVLQRCALLQPLPELECALWIPNNVLATDRRQHSLKGATTAELSLMAPGGNPRQRQALAATEWQCTCKDEIAVLEPRNCPTISRTLQAHHESGVLPFHCFW